MAIALVKLDPARAISLLKHTRPRQIKRWKDDPDTMRLELLAEANEALGRINKAHAFYQLAFEAHTYDTLGKEKCRQAMLRLRPEPSLWSSI